MRGGMKPPVRELRDELIDALSEAREKLAEDVLTPDKIRAAIHAAALSGQASWRLTIPMPVNIKGTATAKAWKNG